VIFSDSAIAAQTVLQFDPTAPAADGGMPDGLQAARA
jgi:hypothetical protein